MNQVLTERVSDPMFEYKDKLIAQVPQGKLMSAIVYYMDGIEKHRDLFGSLKYETENYFGKIEERYQWALDYAVKKVEEIQ